MATAAALAMAAVLVAVLLVAVLLVAVLLVDAMQHLAAVASLTRTRQSKNL